MSHWKRNLLAVLVLGLTAFGAAGHKENQDVQLAEEATAVVEELVDEGEGLHGVQSMSGEPEHGHEGEASVLHLLRNVFSSAMSF